MKESNKVAIRKPTFSAAFFAASLVAILLLIASLACAGQDPSGTRDSMRNSSPTTGAQPLDPTAAVTDASQPRTGQQANVNPTLPAANGSATRAVPDVSDTVSTPVPNTAATPTQDEPPAGDRQSNPVAAKNLAIAGQFFSPGNQSPNDYSAIIYYASQAIEADPELIAAYNLRAHGYNGLNRFQLALEDADNAIELAARPLPARISEDQTRYDSLSFTHLMRAYALTRTGNYDEARDAIATAQDLGDRYYAETIASVIDYNMGNYQAVAEKCCQNIYSVRVGNYASANEELPLLAARIKVNPNDVGALKERARLHESFGEFDKALADIAAVQAQDPGWGSSQQFIIYGLTQRWDEALTIGSALIREEEEHRIAQHADRLPFLYLERAAIRLHLGQSNDAIADLQHALTLLEAISDNERGDEYYGRLVARTENALAHALIAAGRQQQAFAMFCDEDLNCPPRRLNYWLVPDIHSAENPWLHLYAGLTGCGELTNGDI